MSDDKGRLVVISGPSGAGKTSVCRVLKENPAVEFSVSATTRSMRAGEQDVPADHGQAGADGQQQQQRKRGRQHDRTFLTMRMHTKFTPVVAARYSRTNVLLAVGAFRPE